MKYIYITMVQLPTLANKCASIMTNFNCVHSSLSFDENLEKLYAFQIKNKDTPLVGGFVEENHSFYFHGKKDIYLKEMVFKIPVEDSEYKEIVKFVEVIKNDSEYIFNYVSALFMFTIGGVRAYKAYHCIEFISKALSFIKKIEQPKDAHKMLPQDLYQVLKPFQTETKQIYSNDFEAVDNIFLKKIKIFTKIKKSAYSVTESIHRFLLQKVSKKFNYKNVNYFDSDVVN